MGQGEDRWSLHTAVPGRREVPPGAALDPVIGESWARCAAAGLDFAVAPQLHVADAAELRRRRERVQAVRRLALAELETLFQQIAGSNFLLAFADRDGVILDLYADNRFATSASGGDILPGADWSEPRAGTNGLGTALATGRSVAVDGPQHYFLKFADISCTAAPIHDAFGELVGVLDASSYFDLRQRHTRALVEMAASNIENALLLQQTAGDVVFAIHPRAEFLATLGAGLLAFGPGGTLRAASARARALLAGLDPRPGVAFEALFAERFEAFVARLAGGGLVTLRDAMGSMLAAVARQRPLPPPGRAWPLSGEAAPAAGGPEGAAAMPQVPVPERMVHRNGAAHAGLEPGTRPAARTGQPAPGPRTGFVAGDPRVREAVATVEAAVRMNAPILIQGETGTGKELLARHAHAVSGRTGPFVAVNCGALPAELFEAELFGYVGGAYTGARRDGSPGLVFSAHGGTLLLDEVGELPPALQASLLRFLDDRLVRPVGGTKARPVDVLLLAATNVDLGGEVAEKRFRADLLYRLDTVRVALPPLRQRQDFPAMVAAVLRELDASASIEAAAVERLACHAWPGNVRELRAVLTRALLRGDARIDRACIEPLLPPLPAWAPVSRLRQSVSEAVLSEFERTGGCVSRTSRNLGVSRTTVYRYLRQAAPGHRRGG